MSAQANQRTGREFWKSLDELEHSEDFHEWMHEEFPGGLEELDGPSRRSFLKMAAATFALATMPACSKPPHEKIVPYVHEPDDVTPGISNQYATTLTRSGIGLGVLAESYSGRPVKIEGNPDHPASLGATDLFAQAEVLGLADPDRSQAVTQQGGQINTWDEFTRRLRERLSQDGDGQGLGVLTGRITSPTMADQLGAMKRRYPKARWFVHEPINEDTEKAGTKRAFGQELAANYHFDQAKVILSLDSDFLFSQPDSVRDARKFADKRKVHLNQSEEAKRAQMNRLYVAEPKPSITGAKADHRLAVRPSQLVKIAHALAASVERHKRGGDQNGGGAKSQSGAETSANASADSQAGPKLDKAYLEHWVKVAAEDLSNNAQHAVVVAGRGQPAEVHEAAHRINAQLGSIGTCVSYHQPVDQPSGVAVADPHGEGENDDDAGHAKSQAEPGTISELADQMRGGHINTLLMLDTNPVYDAPAELKFAKALDAVDFSVHLGLYQNETAKVSTWHLPMNHELETWSDARAPDGTISVVQPLIRPLYEGKSPSEVLEILLKSVPRRDHQIVYEFWHEHAKAIRQAGSSPDFETWWKRTLREGLIKDTQAKSITPKVQAPASSNASDDASTSKPSDSNPGEMELLFLPDPTIWDGRYANNGWLQEIPDSINKLVWDNAALISPAEGGYRDIHNGDVIRIQVGHHSLEAPAWLTPGHAEGTVSLALGYGRTAAGHVGDGVGVNAYKLRTAAEPWIRPGTSITKTNKHHHLVSTQHHSDMEDRHVFRYGTLDQFREHPEEVKKTPEEPLHLSMFNRKQYTGQQWGMSIDLTACIGCNACTAACNSENNIPVVGKDEVNAGREMHWIRIDRYFEGGPHHPDSIDHQPVPCMQCEDAPCELVCPTGATQHSEDGLNDMVYNRCIGTRYCSNNCPYKVRRFNFFDYNNDDVQSLKLHRNPDVTVRGRGVMEKCTYCTQRIREAQINARTRHVTGESAPSDTANPSEKPLAASGNRKPTEAELEGPGWPPVADGEIVTACQQVCPTQAITFGDINDPNTAISKAKSQPHDYAMLEHLNTFPRTTYLAELRNPNPALG